jgi:hypothetical protein
MSDMNVTLFGDVMDSRMWVLIASSDGGVTFRKGLKCSFGIDMCTNYAEGLEISVYDDADIPEVSVSPICVAHKDFDGPDPQVTFIPFPMGSDEVMEWFR